MNFELKRSILPQFQSPLKFIFSTNNIPQKIGIFLVYLFELCSKSKKKNDNMMTKSRKTTFFDSYIREGNEIEHTIFGQFSCSTISAQCGPQPHTNCFAQKMPKNLLKIRILNWGDQSYRSFNHSPNPHFQRTIFRKKSDGLVLVGKKSLISLQRSACHPIGLSCNLFAVFHIKPDFAFILSN